MVFLVYMYVCPFARMYASAKRGQNRLLGRLELKLQVAVNHSTRVLSQSRGTLATEAAAQPHCAVLAVLEFIV